MLIYELGEMGWMREHEIEACIQRRKMRASEGKHSAHAHITQSTQQRDTYSMGIKVFPKKFSLPRVALNWVSDSRSIWSADNTLQCI